MSNLKIDPKSPLYPGNSSTYGFSNSVYNKSSDKDNISGQTFQEILNQKLENKVRPKSNVSPCTLQVLFNRRPLY